jgi:hypothetical protein
MKTQAKEFVIFDRTETLFESVGKDAFTFACLAGCIGLSYALRPSIWQFVTVSVFFLCLAMKLPWERATRTTVIKTKYDAIAWAWSLPDDLGMGQK